MCIVARSPHHLSSVTSVSACMHQEIPVSWHLSHCFVSFVQSACEKVVLHACQQATTVFVRSVTMAKMYKLGQRCDAICSNGQRCRNVVAQKYRDNHYVLNYLRQRLGLLCSTHWSVCHRGGKVRLRRGVHAFLQGGALVFTPVRGESGAMCAAADLISVRQANVAKVVPEDAK